MLRFISLSLRRTKSTHPSGPAIAVFTKLARLEFGAFYKAILNFTFYEYIKFSFLNSSRLRQIQGRK
jgi:hypothetical protein